jgi:hypothetical protein
VVYFMIVSATGTDWRKLHKEELHNLYSSANIIQVIKSQRMLGRVCCLYGEKRNAYRALT